ncbi:MAG: hypothetical protein JRJ85_19950 [Deltaproteobacteria bacterium]|nr:hypothetical protein [Deltaproteobacteria bacterium]
MDLHKRVIELEHEIQALKDESEFKLRRANEENQRLGEDIIALKEENRRFKKQNALLESQMAALQQKRSEPVASPKKVVKVLEDRKKIAKIKILSGTGSLDSAKKMAQGLRDMGYRVGAVDIAPRRFDRDAVYFSPEFREEAENIAKKAGHNIILKPLTWPTEFNLIVVTGKKP